MVIIWKPYNKFYMIHIIHTDTLCLSTYGIAINFSSPPGLYMVLTLIHAMKYGNKETILQILYDTYVSIYICMVTLNIYGHDIW